MDAVRVIAVNVTSIFLMARGPDGRLEATEGADVVLLKILSTYVPFKYELIEERNHLWGSVDKNGSWTGMIGNLQRKDADMALGWIANTHERDEVVDFSFPYLVDATVFFTASPLLTAKNFAFLDPFQPTVWAMLFLSLPISAFVLTLLNSYACAVKRSRNPGAASSFQWRHLKELKTLFLLFLGQGTYKVYSPFPVRVFMMLWTVAKLVLVFAYCSILLSFLMVPSGERPIETVQQLRDATLSRHYHVAVYKGISHYEYLMAADSGLLKDLADDLRRHPENVLTNFEEGLSRLERGEHLATLCMRMHFGLMSSLKGAHLFHTSRDSIGYNPVSVALRRGFPNRERINRIIHRINQSGVYKRELNIMKHKFSLRAPRPPPKQDLRALSVEDLEKPLQILFVLEAAASACCLLEMICHRKRGRKRTHGNFEKTK